MTSAGTDTRSAQSCPRDGTSTAAASSTDARAAGPRAIRAAGVVARTSQAAARATLVIGAVIITALLATRSSTLQRSMARPAPGFTLTATNGKSVSLAGYRGHDVVLFFNEGAGCDACFYQMREFEQHAAQLTRAGITILPIVMNPASQIRPELVTFELRTPYLIDASGSVSRAYGALGKGMHAGLPGHGFVFIDTHGMERWYGEYPSMHLPAAGLIQQVKAHLGT